MHVQKLIRIVLLLYIWGHPYLHKDVEYHVYSLEYESPPVIYTQNMDKPLFSREQKKHTKQQTFFQGTEV